MGEIGHDLPIPEWEKAVLLAKWLLQTGRVGPEDAVVADGFWACVYPPERTVHVCCGNWSHLTANDVAKGMQPDMPHHHFFNIEFRHAFGAAGGRSVAVSDFIADQCRLQWGFDYPVINNGVDLDVFRPEGRVPRRRPVVVHFVNDRGNSNKGWETVALLERSLDADVLCLDDAPRFFDLPKYRSLAQADLVVLPSAHEGNSYAVLESLASDVPVVAYDVGLMWKARKEEAPVGVVLDRDLRSPQFFLDGCRQALRSPGKFTPHEWVASYSSERFRQEWRDFMRKEFGVGAECSN